MLLTIERLLCQLLPPHSFSMSMELSQACVYLTVACIHDITDFTHQGQNESHQKLLHFMGTKQYVNFKTMDFIYFTESSYAKNSCPILFY